MSLRTVLLFFPLLVAWSGEASAGDPDDFSRITSSLGMGVSTPLNPTKQVVGAGANIVVGAGYNLDRHNAIIGQFMWSGLPPDKDVLRPIWIAAGSRDISGRSNLFAFTADYRFNLEGKRFGAYVIGGGGCTTGTRHSPRRLPPASGRSARLHGRTGDIAALPAASRTMRLSSARAPLRSGGTPARVSQSESPKTDINSLWKAAIITRRPKIWPRRSSRLRWAFPGKLRRRARTYKMRS